MKFLYLTLIILISSNSYAQYKVDENSYFIYDENASINDFDTTEIDLKTNKNIVKDEVMTVESFNKKNIMTFFIGMQQDEFEEKNNFFVRSLTPAFDFRFHRRIASWLGAELDFQISRNAIIPRQSLLIGRGFNTSFEYYLLTQIGEKVALRDQINSGYLFLNLGIGSKIRLFKNHSLDVRAYSNASSFNRYGVETRYLYKVNKSEVGLYFGVEEYNPYKLDYERQGQRSSRFGLLFSY